MRMNQQIYPTQFTTEIAGAGDLIGLLPLYSSATQIAVSPGGCNSFAGDFPIRSAEFMVCDVSTVGANGLDAGTVDADTFYYLHVIARADGSTATLASLYSGYLDVVMPAGFVYARRVGSFRIDSAGDIVPMQWDGDRYRTHTYLASPGASVPLTMSVDTQYPVSITAFAPPSARFFKAVYQVKGVSVALGGKFAATGWPATYFASAADAAFLGTVPQDTSTGAVGVTAYNTIEVPLNGPGGEVGVYSALSDDSPTNAVLVVSPLSYTEAL